MVPKSFYRVLSDIDNNFRVDDRFLLVNCTGHYCFSDSVGGHSTRNDYYLFYITNGEVKVNSPDISKPMKPGDLIIFAPDKEFDYIKVSDEDLIYYWVHFSGHSAAEILKQSNINTNQVYSVGISETISSDFNNLFNVFLNKDSFFDLDCAQKLYSILLSIGKCISNIDSGSKKTSAIINRTLTYIHEHLNENISVNTLAENEHISPSHFRLLFNTATGFSPQSYITLSKLNRASELLRQTDMSINEISEAVGYTDPHYFSRIYSKYFGTPPGKYRKSEIR